MKHLCAYMFYLLVHKEQYKSMIGIILGIYMLIVELTDVCIRTYMYRYQGKMAVVLLYIFILLFRNKIIFLDSKNLLFMHRESDLLLCSSDIFSS